ncbi:SapC family protein [Paracraurococcus lichenis]|uniref:SapC family protein n=1 Tax=Paracraurococcus lichenis TaxID=3064888 RepID=A0ABT9DXV2_9PROT|nr:SapC family protein [Paracraurococcus sp. LOR1-02]MDO9708711.1 SapC family protein [Paracraurococcus sp. LOR1-02]
MSDTRPMVDGVASAPPALPPLYRSLEPLTPERHGALRVRDAGYAFAAAANAVPLAADEFPAAARTLPIVFGAQAPHLPVALTGLAAGSNLYVQADGTWRPGAYIPAYLRRMPFFLVRAAPGSEQLVLCLDTRAPQVSGTEGEPLFTEEGKPTPQLEQALAFTRMVEEGILRTRAITEGLNGLGLLKAAQVEVPHHGKPLRIDGFFAVDRSALMALPAGQLAELRDKGWLEVVYAHLFSLGSLADLARDLAAPAA